MNERIRLTNFDILKLVAAILIVLHHFEQDFRISFNGFNFYNGAVEFGFLVEMFFMISGFLMVLSDNKTKSYIRKFEAKLKRLYPTVFVSMLVTLIVYALYYALFKEYQFETYYSLKQIVTSFLLVNQGWVLEFPLAVNNPVWYICVLMWMYVVYYLIDFICEKAGNKKLKYVFYALLVLIGAYGYRARFMIPFLYRRDCRGYASFFMGCILCDFFKKIRKENKVGRILAFICFGLFIAAVAFLVLTSGMLYWYVWTLLFCPALVLFASLVKQIDVGRFPLELSFHIYLLHYPLSCVSDLIMRIMNISLRANYFVMFIHLVYVVIFSYLYGLLVKRKTV